MTRFGRRRNGSLRAKGGESGQNRAAPIDSLENRIGQFAPEQQSIMMLHRVRLILMRQRTQLSNALRSHLAEFGIVSPIGREGLDRLLTIVADPDDGRVLAEARASLKMLAAQLEGVKAQPLFASCPFGFRSLN